MGTIANKLDKIKTTKDKIKTVTNLSTINTITSETIFKDYPKQILKEYIKIINNGTDELYTNFPKVEDEGIKLELNTEEGPLRMILEGNTSQITNILPEEYTQVDYIESSGTQYIDTGVSAEDINYSFNIDFYGYSSQQKTYPRIFGYQYQGGIFLGNKFWYGNDTNTNATDSLGIFNDKRHLIFASKDYAIVDNITFSFNTSPTNLTKFNFNKIAIFSSINGNTGVVRGDDFSKIKLYNFKIYYSNNLIRNFIPCYRNSDNEVGLYDIVNNTFYTNQGTGVFTYGNVVQIPNPDYPQDIKIVTGEQNVEILNNYFNINEITENSYITNKGVTGSSLVSNVSNYIEVRGEEQITIEYDYDTLLSTSNRSIVYYDENKNYISGQYFKITEKSILITPAQSGFIRFGYDKNCNNIRVFNKKQTYPLSLGNIELAKIGNYKDYIFKNEINNPYYDAELELNEWYLHKEIEKIVLDGSENWTKDSGNDGRYNLLLGNSVLGSLSLNPILCTHFQPRFAISNYSIFLSGATHSLGIIYQDINWDVNLWKTWLSNNNIIVYYALTTPTDTKITDTTLITQLEDLDNAHSYLDTTIIECSSLIENNETVRISATALERID